jgi:anti-sigma factor RsiW
MNDQWTNRLSEYLDGELDSTTHAAVEAHLATCGACYATLTELRAVVARARTLHDSPPGTDLWPGIATQIRRGFVVDRPVRRDRRRFSLTIPQLLAASIALVLLSGGGAWMALRPHEQVNNQPVAETPSPSNPPITAARWKVQSDMAVTELEDALALNEGQLDTATVRVLRQSLAVINRAIGQAQRALKRDPGNAYLNLHLANTMRQKIELLRRANALAS